MPPELNPPSTPDTSSFQDVDVAALSASVSKDIFGGEDTTPSPVEPAAPAPASSEPAVTPAASSRPLPAAWKKEKETVWSSLSPEAQEYVSQREDEVYRGISMYRQGAEAWNKVLAPYQEVLSQIPGVDPAQVLSNMLANHFALVKSPAEKKMELAQKLLSEYGIAFPQGQTTPGQAPAPAPSIDPVLLERLNSVESVIHSFRQNELAERTREVEAFFADPKNEYAKELGQDVLALIQKGEPSLQSAYEKAMWTNPVTRQKLLDKATETARLNALPKPPKTVNGTPGVAPRQGKPKSIDETIDSIVAKYL